jgi:hypothetical protein
MGTAVTQADRYFVQTYAEARRKFLAAAHAFGVEVNSHIHPLRGRDGETLAMDVLLDAARDAESLLIVSSGCHGVEGFGGSGIQLALLSDAAWRESALRAGVAVLYIHALNPHGFSYWRRTTHENIDLNRNFVNFAAPLPQNPAYDEWAALLVPERWPPTLGNRLGVLSLALRRGVKAMQGAISGGQYRHPQGLFFGGQGPSWSNATLRAVLRHYGAQRRRIAWVDLHTGLGPCGVGERIFGGRDDPVELQRARRWWGEVTSIYAGTSTSALVTGQLTHAVYDECPHAEYTGIALEFGTVPILRVLAALRADQWLALHPQAPAEQQRRIKRQMRDAFYIDTAEWKQQLVAQARTVVQQAVTGLAAQL